MRFIASLFFTVMFAAGTTAVAEEIKGKWDHYEVGWISVKGDASKCYIGSIENTGVFYCPSTIKNVGIRTQFFSKLPEDPNLPGSTVALEKSLGLGMPNEPPTFLVRPAGYVFNTHIPSYAEGMNKYWLTLEGDVSKCYVDMPKGRFACPISSKVGSRIYRYVPPDNTDQKEQ